MKAIRVVAWIGEQTEESSLAIACLWQDEDLHGLIQQPLTHFAACLHRLRELRQSLLSLYNRDWFRRVWIRQEVYAAEYVDIRCGSQFPDSTQCHPGAYLNRVD